MAEAGPGGAAKIPARVEVRRPEGGAAEAKPAERARRPGIEALAELRERLAPFTWPPRINKEALISEDAKRIIERLPPPPESPEKVWAYIVQRKRGLLGELSARFFHNMRLTKDYAMTLAISVSVATKHVLGRLNRKLIEAGKIRKISVWLAALTIGMKSAYGFLRYALDQMTEGRRFEEFAPMFRPEPEALEMAAAYTALYFCPVAAYNLRDKLREKYKLASVEIWAPENLTTLVDTAVMQAKRRAAKLGKYVSR